MIHRDPYYETEQQLRNREIREMELERVVQIQREALQDLDCICAGCDERKPVAYTSEDGEVFCADCRYRQQHAGEREMAEAEAAAAERALVLCDPAYIGEFGRIEVTQTAIVFMEEEMEARRAR